MMSNQMKRVSTVYHPKFIKGHLTRPTIQKGHSLYTQSNEDDLYMSTLLNGPAYNLSFRCA